MRPLKITCPDGMAPFFRVEGMGGGLYVNLCWGWGDAVEIPPQALSRLVAAAGPGDIIIARRLYRDEVRDIVARRRDSDSESYAFLTPQPEMRWRPRRSR